MSTIRTIIERVDANKPNAFPTASKVAWLAELDGKITADVFLMDVSEVRQFTYDPEKDLDTELLVRFPHDDIYHYWLSAKIDAENSEYKKYQNTMQLYNASYNNFVNWFLGAYEPMQGGQCARRRNVPSYYITAYGLAVKRGFEGTIDQWLASLVGKSAYAHAQAGGYPGTEDEFNQKMAEKPVYCFTVSTDEEGAYMADMAFADVLQKHNAGFVVLCKIAVDGVAHYLPINRVDEDALVFAGPVENVHVSVEYYANDHIDVYLQPLATQGDMAALQVAVDEIKADLAYVPLDITSISCPQAKTYELGTVVEALTISWALNKAPVKQVLDGVEMAADVRSKTLTGLSISSAKTYTLTVTDERDATDKSSVSLSFLNGVYFGTLADGAEINSAAILTLGKNLQGGRGLTFTKTAAAGQRHAYALPARYGTPTFKDAETGFPAGLALAATIDFTNASGYTESYNLWLSEEPGLGSMTIVVS